MRIKNASARIILLNLRIGSANELISIAPLAEVTLEGEHAEQAQLLLDSALKPCVADGSLVVDGKAAAQYVLEQPAPAPVAPVAPPVTPDAPVTAPKPSTPIDIGADDDELPPAAPPAPVAADKPSASARRKS